MGALFSYKIDEFQKLYHGRWGIEELYKISKVYIDVEDFHSSTERGVKQELYAHLLLINIARIFGSVLHILDHCGHFAEDDQPTLFFSTIKSFLEKN